MLHGEEQCYFSKSLMKIKTRKVVSVLMGSSPSTVLDCRQFVIGAEIREFFLKKLSRGELICFLCQEVKQLELLADGALLLLNFLQKILNDRGVLSFWYFLFVCFKN